MTLMYALIALGSLALVFGLILGFAAIRFRVEGDPIVEQIDTILPQTQCGQCGYPGCRPYAEAIANGVGTSAAARRSRSAANNTSTNEKPTAAPKPYTADCKKV